MFSKKPKSGLFGGNPGKSVTHSTGLFGNRTRVVKNFGTVVERTEIKPRLFGGTTTTTERADGTRIQKDYTQGTFKTHIRTETSGPCFKCNGTGSKTLDCKICSGKGEVRSEAKACHPCAGTGKIQGNPCRKCNGTGTFKPASIEKCRKCKGEKTFVVTCNRCDGSGKFTRKTRS